MENNNEKKLSKIVAKAWSDPQFKEKLLQNPENVFKNEGIDIPQGKKIKILENTNTEYYFVLPQQPSEELTEKDLEDSIAGGFSYCPICCR